VDSVLDVANIDTSKEGLSVSRVDVQDILTGSLDAIRQRCKKRGIATTLDIEPAARATDLQSDEQKIRQILFMLLTNAVNFTRDNGCITVAASVVGGQESGVRGQESGGRSQESGGRSQESGGRSQESGLDLTTDAPQAQMTNDAPSDFRPATSSLVVSVSDTGVGIPTESLEKVFDDFYQVDNSRLGKTPGMGLGLSLVRRLVGMLGGRVWAESAGVGQGSRVCFALPLAGEPPEATKPSGMRRKGSS
jgi:signal transduction histidine kinase